MYAYTCICVYEQICFPFSLPACSFIYIWTWPAVVANTCNPSTWEDEAELRSSSATEWVQSPLGYVRHCLKTTTTKYEHSCNGVILFFAGSLTCWLCILFYYLMLLDADHVFPFPRVYNIYCYLPYCKCKVFTDSFQNNLKGFCGVSAFGKACGEECSGLLHFSKSEHLENDKKSHVCFRTLCLLPHLWCGLWECHWAWGRCKKMTVSSSVIVKDGWRAPLIKVPRASKNPSMTIWELLAKCLTLPGLPHSGLVQRSLLPSGFTSCLHWQTVDDVHF